MSTKQFYLLGEAASTARDIEMDDSADFEELQSIVASHFAIVDPRCKLSKLPYSSRRPNWLRHWKRTNESSPADEHCSQASASSTMTVDLRPCLTCSTQKTSP